MEKSSSAERKTCVSIFDPDNEDSVYSRMTARGKNAMDQVPDYLKAWSIRKIESKFAHRFTTRDRILKVAFWREFNYALDKNKPIDIKAVCRGVCPTDYFYNSVFENNPLLMWLLYPSASYENQMHEMLDLSTRNLREILALPVRPDGKNVDWRAVNAKIKIHELVENRVRGIAPQTVNINQKSVNMNVNRNEGRRSPDIGRPDVSRMSLGDIDKSLEETKKTIKELPASKKPPKGEIIDAEEIEKLL